jgi:hypothetical protein
MANNHSAPPPPSDSSGSKPTDAASEKSGLASQIQVNRGVDPKSINDFEKNRTNASNGSFGLPDDPSMQLDMGNGQIASRHNKDVVDPDAARLNAISPKAVEKEGKLIKTGLDYDEQPKVTRGVQNIGDLVQKVDGVGEGLTQSVVQNLGNAMADPQLINKKLIATGEKFVEGAIYAGDKVAKLDWQGAVADGAKVVQKVADASAKYDKMSQHDQGKVIGNVMSNFVPDLPQALQEAEALGIGPEGLSLGEAPPINNLASLKTTKVNERPSMDVVKQKDDLSCIAACGQMLGQGRFTQADLQAEFGQSLNFSSLAGALGPEWKAGPYEKSNLDQFLKSGPFMAEIRDSGEKTHAILIDGLTVNGNVNVLDPQDGNRYEMTRANFEKQWTSNTLFRK